MKVLTKVWKGFTTGMSRTALVLAILGTLAVFTQMFAVVYETISRYVFNAPTPWSVDLSTMLVLFIAFGSAAYVYEKNGHVAMDILSSRFKNKTKFMTLVVVDLLSLGATSVYAWQGWNLVMRSIKAGRALPGALATPEWIPQLSLSVGFTLVSIFVIIKLVEHIQKLVRRPEPGTPVLPNAAPGSMPGSH